MAVLALGGDGTTPNANPDHDIADENEGERQQVAEYDIRHNKVDVLFVLGRPLFDAQLNVRTTRRQTG